MWCGVGEPADCLVEGDVCDSGVCARFFDCGIHKCEKPRHRPSPQPSECPPSPSHVTHCPCEKSIIAPSPSAERSQHTFAAAQISSPLAPPLVRFPTRCSHPCQAKCHTGHRPPCTIEITRPCRSWGTTRSLPCHHGGPSDHPAEESGVFCDRPCTVIRACGRHQCRRVCCPLASLASTSVNKERSALGQGREMEMGLGLGRAGGDRTSVC